MMKIVNSNRLPDRFDPNTVLCSIEWLDQEVRGAMIDGYRFGAVLIQAMIDDSGLALELGNKVFPELGLSFQQSRLVFSEDFSGTLYRDRNMLTVSEILRDGQQFWEHRSGGIHDKFELLKGTPVSIAEASGIIQRAFMEGLRGGILPVDQQER